jgi:hypothetical protein
MSTIIQSWLRAGLLLSLVLFGLAATATELVPHKAGYSAKIKKGVSLNGEAVRELTRLEDGRWQYRFDVDSFVADIRESVLFRWENDHITPDHYTYSLRGMMIKDRQQSAQFDWPGQRASGKDRGREWQTPIPPDVLDRLGYQLQLLIDVQSGQTEMTYPILHKGRIDIDTFRVIGHDTIDTVLGRTPAIVVEKVRAPTKKRKTHLWFARDHRFLLLKMTQLEEDGEEYEINLKWAELDGQRVQAVVQH